jgi:SH3 domain-containing YSC84-like protein 1
MPSHSIASDSVLGGSSDASAFLAHEVRNLVNVAILSFDVLRATGAGVSGDQGSVLRRSLNDLRTLINRSLSDLRAEHGRDVIAVNDFINEIGTAATLEAHARGIRLVVPSVPDGLVVEADRHELAAALRNLVQNAVKFTRPGTTVGLRVHHRVATVARPRGLCSAGQQQRGVRRMMKSMFRHFCLVLSVVVSTASVFAQGKEDARLETAGLVMEEVLDLPDGIPQDLLDKAECAIVIPSVTKVALGVGGSYGRGAMVCRTGDAFDGPWGAPAMYALDGGSFGLQLGGQSTDLVLLVMNARGVEALLASKVQLGASMSVAAGPKGRDATASTDASLRAEMLSYSRSRGLFAGLSLEGTSLRPDDDASAQIYGHQIRARTIVTGTEILVTTSGRRLVDTLQRRSALNTSAAR